MVYLIDSYLEEMSKVQWMVVFEGTLFVKPVRTPGGVRRYRVEDIDGHRKSPDPA